jgi:hypothetical protein
MEEERTDASRATVHRQPVHQPGDFTHASLDRNVLKAWIGDMGVDGMEVGLIDGRFSNRPRPAVIDEADCESSLPRQLHFHLVTEGGTDRTRFSTGVNAIPCTNPAPAPAMAERRVGCRGMICGPLNKVSSVISSSSSSSSS